MRTCDGRGFTLIEVVVVIAILGVLAMAAISLFSGTNQKKNLDVAARGIAADMQYVQQKNVNGLPAYQLSLDKANKLYRILYDGVNTEKTVRLPAGVEIVGTTFATISFNDDGTLANHITDGNDYVEVRLTNQTSQVRYVIVQLVTGRIRVDTAAP